MLKQEIKVEFKNSKELTDLIEKSYFLEGDSGKILKKEHYLKVDESEDVDYSIFKGLDGAIVKLINEDVINGTFRLMVDETTSDVRLYPVSIYVIKEESKYSFY